jgi:hypothetical protein
VDLGQLSIGGGVEVEGLDVDADLVRPDLRRGVEAFSGLWQRDLLPDGSRTRCRPTGELSARSTDKLTVSSCCRA